MHCQRQRAKLDAMLDAKLDAMLDAMLDAGLTLSLSRPPAFFFVLAARCAAAGPRCPPYAPAMRHSLQCALHEFAQYGALRCLYVYVEHCSIWWSMFENIGVSSFYNECRNAVQPFNAVQGGHGGGGAKSPG